jgi:hypothetical protein
MPVPLLGDGVTSCWTAAPKVERTCFLNDLSSILCASVEVNQDIKEKLGRPRMWLNSFSYGSLMWSQMCTTKMNLCYIRSSSILSSQWNYWGNETALGLGNELIVFLKCDTKKPGDIEQVNEQVILLYLDYLPKNGEYSFITEYFWRSSNNIDEIMILCETSLYNRDRWHCPDSK